MSLATQARKWAEIANADIKVDIPRDRQDLYDLLNFEPRHVQKQSLDQTFRFMCEVWHRRAGKSVSKVVKLVERAHYCPFPNGRYAYLAPTYAQAEDIAWTYLVDFASLLPWFDPDRDVEKSRLAVWLPSIVGSRSRVRLYGVDSPKQRLRGAYMDGGVFDEFQDQPMSVWTEQARPMLADENRRGKDIHGRPNQWADFIGTPKGRNQLHKVYQRAKLWFEGKYVMDEDPITGRQVKTFSNEWFAGLYRASETGIISRDELRAALREMGYNRYQQEFECSFDAAIEGSIYGRDLEQIKRLGRIQSVEHNRNTPVNTAWDLGWDDATAIWFFQQVGTEVNLIDYFETSHMSIPELCDVLREKGYNYGYHLFPWDVEVTEMGTGKSRKKIFQENGLRPSVNTKVGPYDKIAAVRNLLYSCNFNQGTTLDGLDRLALYQREYDEKNGVFRETPKHDAASHAADALGELAIGLKKSFALGFERNVSPIGEF